MRKFKDYSVEPERVSLGDDAPLPEFKPAEEPAEVPEPAEAPKESKGKKGTRIAGVCGCTSSRLKYSWLRMEVCATRQKGGTVKENVMVKNPHDVSKLVHEIYPVGQLTYEVFLVLVFDTKHKLLGLAEAARGGISSVQVPIAEVLRPALLLPARAVILIHNHPSGDPTPSKDDDAITARIVASAELVGLKVLDHLVLTDDPDFYFSYVDAGRRMSP